jgi:hypothetical protein
MLVVRGLRKDRKRVYDCKPESLTSKVCRVSTKDLLILVGCMRVVSLTGCFLKQQTSAAFVKESRQSCEQIYFCAICTREQTLITLDTNHNKNRTQGSPRQKRNEKPRNKRSRPLLLRRMMIHALLGRHGLSGAAGPSVRTPN